jgi:ABC-type xylose transport system permease subunit
MPKDHDTAGSGPPTAGLGTTHVRSVRSRLFGALAVAAAGAIVTEVVNAAMDRFGLPEERARVARAVIRGAISGGVGSALGHALSREEPKPGGEG